MMYCAHSCVSYDGHDMIDDHWCGNLMRGSKGSKGNIRCGWGYCVDLDCLQS